MRSGVRRRTTWTAPSAIRVVAIANAASVETESRLMWIVSEKKAMS